MGMGGGEFIHERTRVQSAGWRGQGRSKAGPVVQARWQIRPSQSVGMRTYGFEDEFHFVCYRRCA